MILPPVVTSVSFLNPSATLTQPVFRPSTPPHSLKHAPVGHTTVCVSRSLCPRCLSSLLFSAFVVGDALAVTNSNAVDLSSYEVRYGCFCLAGGFPL